MFIKKSGVLQILLGLSIKLIVLSENAYASSAILRQSIVLRRGFSTTMPTNRTVDWIMFMKGGIVSPYPPAEWIPQLLVAPPCPATTTTTSVHGFRVYSRLTDI